MPFVSGYLNVRSGGHPDNALPGHERPVDPGYGMDLGHGVDNTLPTPPPMVWPPLTPSAPIQPAPPGTPPGVIWPPMFAPVDPGYGRPVGPGHVGGGPMPGGEHPSGQPVPPPTGSAPPRPTPAPTPPRPDHALPSQTYWVVVGVPGVGWRYVAIDPSLTVGYPLPEAPPAHVDAGLPPTAQPRR